MHEILNNLHQLPSIPAVVQELIVSFDNPDLDSQHLAGKIGQDQALSAKVLRVANSAFYGLPRQVGSIQEAVTVLGFSAVRSLVLSAGFVDAFSTDGAACVDRNLYWQRSLTTATYAKAVAKCLRLDGEMAFSAGLLHDIGILVLDVCDHERFTALWLTVQEGGSGLIEAERTTFGFDHAELGAEVARRWKFPPVIEDAIRYHYQPEHQTLQMLTRIVQVAALLARFSEEKLPGDQWFGYIPQNLRNALKLDRDKLCKHLPLPEQLEAAKNQIFS
ncbi:MAG: HDOD domain-containing protein [Sulfurimicrobium sp.]|nr:HDOD domain-containing protein [Sulfurimicrobium sp.]MDP2197132.1 HDOD domain-containing protein [Sulfurimicrobium sp.]MDP3689292.1 HDOD domain-containing protein [Sulfurimicrobium sp.]